MPNQKWEFGNLGIFLSPLNKGEARYPHGQRAFSLLALALRLSLTFALYLCESQIPALFNLGSLGHHAVFYEVHRSHDLHPDGLALSG